MIGKLNYLEKATRPDISFATHQCAHFAAAPKKSHTRVVRWLGRYLLHMKKRGMRFRTDITCGLEVFVDASFAGNWDKKDTQTGDRDTARSRHGYIILYYGCPLIWKSQLQTKIVLSSTESEYTGLSYALHEAIPLLSLLDKLKEQGFPVDQTKATIQYVLTAVKNVEAYLDSQDSKHWKMPNKADTPLTTTYRPELDVSRELNVADAAYYQSLIGI